MRILKPVDLYFVPAGITVEARIASLSRDLIRHRMGEAWWSDARINAELAEGEIDRHWNWSNLKIERDEKVLKAGKIAVVTGDGAVQGAAMYSREAVTCAVEPGELGLFVELLFTAPRNRPWIRPDRAEQFRGVGVELLIFMAEASARAGFDGRLKLESSPGFVTWYAKRGLLETPEKPILHEGVTYTPMELTADAAKRLLAAS